MSKNSTLMKRNEEAVRGLIRRLNYVPKEILEAAAKEALTEAMELTTVDSGNALYHWTIVGFRKRDIPDSKRVPFSNRKGQSPVGERGDAKDGKDNRSVVSISTAKEGYAAIERMVWVENRVAFTIYNDLFNTELTHYKKNSGFDEKSMAEISNAAREKARVASSKAKASFIFMGESGKTERVHFYGS